MRKQLAPIDTIIYQSKSGALELKTDKEHETIWLTQEQKDNKVYKIKHFNLDAVLSVGYKINSKKATHFRQWATKTLKEHIQRGYDCLDYP